AMSAILMAYVLNIDTDVIIDTLRTFKGVEHRLEFVTNKDGIMFVNDSKGTNPDSTIKAITSYEKPIVLIAGGYEKQ
ncbi:UDP-N-acetylmuramoyl-L-alanine--D-glutamate ligase, partial [bacterium 210820-DFI.6.52]|nr:UDP-N-acetylmuramoyl-L-alanine--D-glutamate ligase [bacterium 210820-DFI.6.52]